MATFNTYKKRREVILLGVEATRGTVATKQYAFAWLSKNYRSVPGIIENNSALGSDILVNDSAVDVWHSEGSLGGKVTENNLAYLFNGMFNKVTTTNNGDGTYTHQFARDINQPRKTFTFWDVRPGGTRQYRSVMLDNLGLKIDVGDSGAWLEAELSAKGWKHDDVASPTPAFIAGEKEYTSRMVSLFIATNVAGLSNASAQVKPRSISLQMEETTKVDHYVGEVNNDPELDSEPAVVKGSMVIKYRSTDYDDAYFANAVRAAKIVIQNGNTKIEITGSKVRFREVTDSDDINDVVTQTVSFAFESDLTNAGKDIDVKVTNTLSTPF